MFPRPLVLPPCLGGYSPRALKQRYPWEKTKERIVTIGLGVVCSDGIVLAVDNELSQDPIQFEGQKLFPLKQGSNYTILAAASNNADTAKKGIQILQTNLSQAFVDKAATLDEITSWIETSLKKLWFEYIDPAPTKERSRLHCNFLFAIWVSGENPKLFYSNRNMLHEERVQKTIGTGVYFSTFVSQLLLGLGVSGRPTIEEVNASAVYIVGTAKDYIQGIGHASIVHALHNDGRWSSLTQFEIADIFASFGDLTRTMQYCLRCLDVETVADDDLDRYTTLFRASVERFREGQRKRLQQRAKRRAGVDIQEHPPTPESPTQLR